MGCDSQFDDAQHCSWESSVEAPTRSRLVLLRNPKAVAVLSAEKFLRHSKDVLKVWSETTNM